MTPSPSEDDEQDGQAEDADFAMNSDEEEMQLKKALRASKGIAESKAKGKPKSKPNRKALPEPAGGNGKKRNGRAPQTAVGKAAESVFCPDELCHDRADILKNAHEQNEEKLRHRLSILQEKQLPLPMKASPISKDLSYPSPTRSYPRYRPKQESLPLVPRRAFQFAMLRGNGKPGERGKVSDLMALCMMSMGWICRQ